MKRELLRLCLTSLIGTLPPLYQSKEYSSRFSKLVSNIPFERINSDNFHKFLKQINGYICDEETQISEGYSVDLSQPLTSIFTFLYGPKEPLYDVNPGLDEIPAPSTVPKTDKAALAVQLGRLLQKLENIPPDIEHLNQILDVCDDSLIQIPCPSNRKEYSLSLSDKIKFSTALSSCLAVYLWQNQKNSFKLDLTEKVQKEESLLLFSCDLSGIQKFIYTVSGEGVLKSLRSRSFYLDFLQEHLLCTLLNDLDLPVSNILYSGGGRAYLLLPNTEVTKQTIRTCMKSFNGWLLENFDILLYIAYGFVTCSVKDLFLKGGMDAYNRIYLRLSAELSANKSGRYQPEQIQFLNRQTDSQHTRECRICSRSDREIDSDGVCPFCRDFISASAFLTDESLCPVVVSRKFSGLPCLRLPSSHQTTDYLYFLKEKQILSLEKDIIVQIYHRGETGPGLRFETGSFAHMVNGQTARFEQLADASSGINRIAVLRADVDNLGQAFMKGFENTISQKKYRPLLLTAAFSRSLSIFFKRYFKRMAAGDLREKRFSISGKPNPEKNLVIVYSGGDDLFLAGAWNDVVDTAVDLRNGFEKYTAGSLTLSAGIGIFKTKYPLYAMAQETESLEDVAKSIDSEKNKVALFGMETQKDSNGKIRAVCSHCYRWKDFIDRVVGEKLRCLQNYFNQSGELQIGNGNAFLYRMKSYIEKTQKDPQDKINIARFAYLLARLQPTGKSSKMQNEYQMFTRRMYGWILSQEDRRQLLTAIDLYIYLKRSKDQE